MKRTLLTLTLLAGLVACTPDPTPLPEPTPTPTPNGTAPIVALTINGVGTQVLGSSLTVLGGNLNAQDTSALTFTLDSVQTFTATVNGQDTRHFHAAYRVGNVGSAPLAFVPVSLLDDAKVDEMGSPLTEGNTPYTLIRLFNGTSAPAYASSLMLGQPKTFNAATGVVENVTTPGASVYNDVSLTTTGAKSPAGTLAGYPAGTFSAGQYTGKAFITQGTGATRPLNVGLTLNRTAHPGAEPFSVTLLLTAIESAPTSATPLNLPTRSQQ
ncbi:hypothetical protein E7T06_03280 [Deinococcus sp. Arct2-2]|uniref:hypothetical protein n=1 Tax=Deinococcus sp. Arct2-2 TaxID=2568653 RepID=UPI0010A45FA7|nr:hypothetical protein [Deinococcus sp. Arct2-2]THF71372.1 hypothetical protein E7T06_03280 [Deinococcus sp. Arct2-2]